MVSDVLSGFARFTDNVSRLRNTSVHTQIQDVNEVIDDVVVIGSDDDAWERYEQDGRLYMTRR